MLEIEINSFIEEYISLRHEINQRTQNQLYLLAVNIASFPAIFSLTNFNLEKITLLLSISIIYCVIAWLYIEQDVFLTQAATYLNKRFKKNIVNRITELTQTSDKIYTIMEWEEFRHTVLFKEKTNKHFMKTMTFFRILATFGPSIVIFVIFSYYIIFQSDKLSEVKIIDYILYVSNASFIVVLLYYFLKVNKLYRGIEN